MTATTTTPLTFGDEIPLATTGDRHFISDLRARIPFGRVYDATAIISHQGHLMAEYIPGTGWIGASNTLPDKVRDELAQLEFDLPHYTAAEFQQHVDEYVDALAATMAIKIANLSRYLAEDAGVDTSVLPARSVKSLITSLRAAIPAEAREGI